MKKNMYEKMIEKVALNCYICGLSFDKNTVCEDCRNNPKNGGGAISWGIASDIAHETMKKKLKKKLKKEVTF